MDCNRADLPVPHHLLGFSHICVHCISNTYSHLILWHPLLHLPSIFPSIRHFSKELAVCIRWPLYWSFSFSISPFNEYSGLISLKIDWFISLLSKGLSVVFSNTTVWRHLFFGALLSLRFSSHNHMWPLGRPQPWLYRLLLGEWCLCFSTNCIGLS